jgi:hypothetical protein
MTQLAEQATKFAISIRKKIISQPSSPFYVEDTVAEIIKMANESAKAKIKAKDEYIDYLKGKLDVIKIKYNKEG